MLASTTVVSRTSAEIKLDLIHLAQDLTISNAEKLGFTVGVEHLRNSQDEGQISVPAWQIRKYQGLGKNPRNYLSPHGGGTCVTLTKEGYNVVATGTCCCSPRDVFSRRKGTLTALGRAFAALCKHFGWHNRDLIREARQLV